MSRCVPAGRSPVFSSLGSLVSCFGRVWSGLSRRVPRCARRGPVSFLSVVPCRRARVIAAGAPPRVSRVHLYFFRLRVAPRRCRRGVGRRARLRGKGLPIFCHLSCHDATTHHTMLEDLRSPQQVHPLASSESDGNPTQSGASRAAAQDQQTSSPPSLASSASRHHLLLPSVFPQCADRLPQHRGCRRPATFSEISKLETYL